MKHMTATDSKSVYCGNNRFRDTTNLLLYIKYTQAGYSIFADISTTPLYILVTATAKSLITGTASLISPVVVGVNALR